MVAHPVGLFHFGSFPLLYKSFSCVSCPAKLRREFVSGEFWKDLLSPMPEFLFSVIMVSDFFSSPEPKAAGELIG